MTKNITANITKIEILSRIFLFLMFFYSSKYTNNVEIDTFLILGTISLYFNKIIVKLKL